MKKTNVILITLLFLLVVGFHRPAFAYLEPGTGSMMLQLLLGDVVVAVR